MKIRSIILPIAALFISSCFSRGEPVDERDEDKAQMQPTVLSVFIKPGGKIGFNAFPDYLYGIVFRNNTDKDTVITKKLFLDKPLLLAYGSFLVVPDGESIFRTYSLLLNPGDSVRLREGVNDELTIQSTSGFPNFLDSLISIPKDFYWHNLEQQQAKQLKKIGLKGLVQRIDSLFIQNETTINQLKNIKGRTEVLKKLNANIKYTAIAHLLVDPSVVNSAMTDSLFEDMYAHKEEIHSIDAINNRIIFEAIISYSANKRNKNLDKNDIWVCAAEADAGLVKTAIYKEALVTDIATNFVQTPKKIPEINKKLQALRGRNQFLDTLYQLTGILSKTFTEYKQAKIELETFAGGNYSYIIENDEKSANHEKKSITHLAAVNLYNFAGNQSDFKQIITNTNYKLTLIDFWASWCIPCINEMPALKKVENKLKDKPIQFVAISIDKEEDVGKWIDAAKRNKIFHKPSQYRLANFKQSPLTKLINLKNIPRYLVIDDKGNILDDDFYRPSDNRFELELLKYLD